MLIYGFGGHARVIWTALLALSQPVTAFFDDNQPVGEWNQVPVIGPYEHAIHRDSAILLAIGDNSIRRRLSQVVTHSFGVVSHPSAIIDSSCTVGEGSMILHAAVLQLGVTVGTHTIVNSSASIDHDSHIGHFTHVAPGVTICGEVTIGSDTLVGAGAIVLPGVSIGDGVIVGAGTVVRDDVPDGATVVGNPAVRLDLEH